MRPARARQDRLSVTDREAERGIVRWEVRTMARSFLICLLLLPFALQAQDTGEAAHKKLCDKLKAAKSLSVTVETRVNDKVASSFTFKALRPNYSEMITKAYEDRVDGTKRHIYYPDRKQFQSSDAPKTILMRFPGLEAFVEDPKDRKLVGASTERFEGADRQALRYEMPERPGFELTVYLDTKTGLPVGAKQVVPTGAGDASERSVLVYVYKDLKLDVSMKPEQFAWQPPADAKPYEPPNYEAKLLPVGSQAPEFRLKSPTGGELSLSEAIKGNKATLVNFWFHGCGPCRAEFPHLQKMFKDMRSQGFNIVAINYGDSAEVINKYVDENKFEFSIVMNGKDDADMSKVYGVQAYPTNYVLDSSGKIVARFVGFNEKGLLEALKKLGLEPAESP